MDGKIPLKMGFLLLTLLIEKRGTMHVHGGVEADGNTIAKRPSIRFRGVGMSWWHISREEEDASLARIMAKEDQKLTLSRCIQAACGDEPARIAEILNSLKTSQGPIGLYIDSMDI